MPLLFSKNKVHVAGAKIFKHNNVSFYWGEKAWLFIDFLQIYGVLWNMAQSWGWPYIWIKWTKWTVWANIDYFSTTENGSTGGSSQSFTNKFGEMENYIEYSFLFMIVPVVILACVVISRLVTRQYGTRYDIYESGIVYWALYLTQLLYLPVCLAVARLYYCENGVLSVDPTNACLEGQHLIISVLGVVCTLPLLIGLPIYIYKCVHDVVIFDMESDHEKRLQAWELETVFGLNTFWEHSQLWLTSSFNRGGAYFRFNILMFKAYSVSVFLLFRFNIILQAALFWVGTVYVFFMTLKLMPFRLSSSNIIASVLVGLQLINSSFAVCNAFGAENSIMVSSVESVWLLSFNAAGFFITVIVLGLCLTGNLDRWPSSMTLSRISHSAKWPSMLKWIETIKEANAVNLDVCLSPPETADIMALEEMLRQLRKHWMHASSIGSVFTVILSDKMTQLMITHSLVSPSALRSKKHWDKEYIKSGREMFDARHKKFNLWNEKKRRMQLKLFAVSALMGSKIVKKVNDYDRDSYGMPLDVRRRLSVAIGSHQPSQSAEAKEKWFSEEANAALLVTIASLTNRTEAALREKEEVADYAKALQSDEDKQQEQEEYVKQVDELIELYEEWDVIIGQFESKVLPGGGGASSEMTEDWYTYRHVAANTLDTIRAKIVEKEMEDDSDSEYEDAKGGVNDGNNGMSEVAQPLLSIKSNTGAGGELIKSLSVVDDDFSAADQNV